MQVIPVGLVACAAAIALIVSSCTSNRESGGPESFRDISDRTYVIDRSENDEPTAGASETSEAGPESPNEPSFYSNTASYTATIVTAKGTVEIELYNDIAGVYVRNFVDLAQSGFYDGVRWHRVIPGFVIQAGISPTGIQVDEFDDEFHPDMKHNDAGILSMANRGLNTNTSQFFITHGPTPHLDPYVNGEFKDCGTPGVSCHAVFGKVTSGLDVVLATEQDDVIQTITIQER